MQPYALIAILACAAAVVLTGCGGGEASTTASSTSTTTRAETTRTTDEADPEAQALREQFNEQLLELLTTTQGMSRDQAECAIRALDARVSDEEIRRAIESSAETGESPQDLIDEAFDAGTQCAGE